MNKSRQIIREFLEKSTLQEVETQKEETKSEIIDALDELADNVVVDNVDVPNLGEVEKEMKKAEPPSVLIPKPFKDFSGKIKNIKNPLRGLKTPGGISLLLVIILFILFAIKKVEGKNTTRLGLFFQTLMGNTQLEGFESKNADSAVEKFGDYIESGDAPIMSGLLLPPSLQGGIEI